MKGLIEVISPKDSFVTAITLPSSKSISNRALIIAALSGSSSLENLSHAEDTRILKEIISGKAESHFVKNAGTVARFLTAYFSVKEGEHLLDGSPRMRERPMQPLITALRKLGADITCTGKEGFLPLKIRGRKLKGGKVLLDVSESSQFLSALLLIAPYFKEGLEVSLSEDPVSRPYIEMTINLMRQAGADVEWKKNLLVVRRSGYLPAKWKIEPDWSSAAFWYEAVALSEGSEAILKGLPLNSVQGDAFVSELFYSLGVDTEEMEEGLLISRNSEPVSKIIRPRSFINHPDLSIPYAAAVAGLGLTASLTGLHTLKYKESDRLEALKKELAKTGIRVIAGDESLSLSGAGKGLTDLSFEGHNDHRMVMAMAMLALKFGKVLVSDPEEVEKSYPLFWKDLESAGFTLNRR